MSPQAEEQELSREITIINKLGIHARPAAMIVKLANQFKSDIFIEKDNERINGKSIMGIMMLAAGKGSKIKVYAKGIDAELVLEQFEKLFKSKFGEE